MSSVCLILGDQLSASIFSLKGVDKANDVVLLCEVLEEATYVRHHQKKSRLYFRNAPLFKELKSHGFVVRYVKLDDPGNTGSLKGEVRRALSKFKANRIIVTEPSEYRLLQILGHGLINLELPSIFARILVFFVTLLNSNDGHRVKNKCGMSFFTVRCSRKLIC